MAKVALGQARRARKIPGTYTGNPGTGARVCPSRASTRAESPTGMSLVAEVAPPADLILIGIIASGPPSLSALADCIIALSAAERGLARHHPGGQAQTRVPARPPARGFYGREEHPRPRR
jgi:hypothetical protein